MGSEGGAGFRVDGSLSVYVCVLGLRWRREGTAGRSSGGLEEGGMGGVDQPKRRITRLRLTAVLLLCATLAAADTVYTCHPVIS